MKATLIQLRDELIASLEKLPGFRSVGLGKSQGRPVFIVSVDPGEFRGDAPTSFHGYGVEVRNLGCPVGHVTQRTVH